MDININYLKGTPGTLNIVEWIASLLVLICASTSPDSITGGGWVYFTSITCTILSFALLLMHMIRVVEALQNRVNWFLIRLVYVGIFSVFYFISMCISAAGAAAAQPGRTHSSNTAAAVFAAVAIVGLIWDGIDQIKRKREGPDAPPPTGDRLATSPEMRYT